MERNSAAENQPVKNQKLLSRAARRLGKIARRSHVSESQTDETTTELDLAVINTLKDYDAAAELQKILPRSVPGPIGVIHARDLDPDRIERQPSDFTAEEYAIGQAKLDAVLSERTRILREANGINPEEEGRVRIGASNQLGDPWVWAADWRECLPLDHPQRQMGGPIIVQGTFEASENTRLAHEVLLDIAVKRYQ